MVRIRGSSPAQFGAGLKIYKIFLFSSILITTLDARNKYGENLSVLLPCLSKRLRF